MTAKEKIDRCKTHILLAYPWWATLLLQMRVLETEQVPTMAVDGTYLYYNPKFTLTLTDSECKAVLMHETAHCALLHPFRRQWRDPLLWNFACDAAVNALLLADGLTLPKGCVPPASLEKTAEQLYEEMKQNAQEIAQDVFGPGELGDPGEQSESDGGCDPKAAKQMTEQSWRDVLAASRGMEPAGLSRAILIATEPKKDWKAELARFISAFRKSDAHTWNRTSRRIAGMPGWKREPECTIAICIDTSGSISNTQLSEFATECSAILNLSGVSAYVISSDAAVGEVIAPGESIPATFKGGGGTSFIPAIRKAEELQVSGIVYLTDGCGDFPSDSTVPVLWTLTHPVEVPFGESIHLT